MSFGYRLMVSTILQYASYVFLANAVLEHPPDGMHPKDKSHRLATVPLFTVLPYEPTAAALLRASVVCSWAW